MKGVLAILTPALAGCLSTPGSDGDRDPFGPVTVTSEPMLDIPFGSSVVDSLLIDDDECAVESLSVDVIIRHDYRGELSIVMESPTHRAVTLKDYDGNDGNENVIGNYPLTLSPIEDLELFMGLTASGGWSLTVSDAPWGSEQVGTLEAWTLNVHCE